jgi:hypothetical protein
MLIREMHLCRVRTVRASISASYVERDSTVDESVALEPIGGMALGPTYCLDYFKHICSLTSQSWFKSTLHSISSSSEAIISFVDRFSLSQV